MCGDREAQLNDFADGRIGSIPSVTYGVTDGLRSNECNEGSPGGFKTRDGKLWFSTIQGAAVIDPKNLKLNVLLPTVVIERVIIDGKPTSSIRRIAAPPGRGDLEVHFTAPSFLAPEKVQFRYKLE